MLPDVTHGNKPLMIAEAAGAAIETVTAVLDQLSLDDLEAVSQRVQELSCFSLAPDLIATVRLHRIKRIKMPDIIGSTIEYKGHYRIAWNKAWLENNPNSADSLK